MLDDGAMSDAIGWDIYYEAKGSVGAHVRMLEPLLRAWIGEDPAKYLHPSYDRLIYMPDRGFHISVEHNVSYGKSNFENDRFHFVLGSVDLHKKIELEVHLDRMRAALEVFWANGIPTCTPGWDDEMPNEGGATGPIPWPW
ncbi:Hypothetical protein A7982_02285 [Minicystis rosea]|nr:Hypothetical protein A7982_02285 [Minicystis rosea]